MKALIKLSARTLLRLTRRLLKIGCLQNEKTEGKNKMKRKESYYSNQT